MFSVLLARDIDVPKSLVMANIYFKDMAKTWPRLAARVLALGLSRQGRVRVV